jgi:hypothetical protein
MEEERRPIDQVFEQESKNVKIGRRVINFPRQHYCIGTDPK